MDTVFVIDREPFVAHHQPYTIQPGQGPSQYDCSRPSVVNHKSRPQKGYKKCSKGEIIAHSWGTPTTHRLEGGRTICYLTVSSNIEQELNGGAGSHTVTSNRLSRLCDHAMVRNSSDPTHSSLMPSTMSEKQRKLVCRSRVVREIGLSILRVYLKLNSHTILWQPLATNFNSY